MNIDKLDRLILRELEEDSRRPVKEIAKKIGIPATTLYSRLKKLESSGIIKNYTVIIDHAKLGMPVTAFIFASFSKTEGVSQREIVRQISKIPNIQEVHIITGDWDILIKAKHKDVESIGRFVVDELRGMKGIEKTLTCLVLHTAKEEANVQV
ncbi:MAG TPA: Lrp/AsnC family transcriptional regulator [Geobacterales bacterium]|nr:Lrp/AsnC family transcriptional regulator [Geobacterales bacterium]